MTDWTVAYEQHRPAILTFLARRLRCREDAKDLCQETFARVMSAAGAPATGAPLRGYLFRTAGNLVRDHARRTGRVIAESGLGGDTDLGERADPRARDPELEAQRAELADTLQGLIRELPPEQRIAFTRGVLAGQPYAKIAAENGWSLAKVKVNVFRARRRLIEALGDRLPAGCAPGSGQHD